MTARGVIGGGQLGCDYQIGSWVFGLQGLVDLSGTKGSDVCPTRSWSTTPISKLWQLLQAGSDTPYCQLFYSDGKAGGAYTHSLYDISVPNGEARPFWWVQ